MVVVVVVVLLMSWGQLRWVLLLLLLHLVVLLLVMVVVLVVVVVVLLLLLLQLLLVMAGRRGTHFKRRTRPTSGCHLLLLSVARIGHGRVMMRRLTRIGFLVERDPLLLGCLGGRFDSGRVQSIESGQDLLTRPFLAPFPLLWRGTSGQAATR